MEPIAIVGIGCRFPSAHGPKAFWQLLRDGVDAITEVPSDRWDIDKIYDADASRAGKMNTRCGGFIDGVDGFDAALFEITPREARRMDPQQRLALEVAWEALEDAGLPPKGLAGSSVGVFLGFGVPENLIEQLHDPNTIDEYTNTGSTPCVMANRLSYFFDFRGPSMSIDTACSSSLVAVHLACQSLRLGEASLAVAGGVNLMTNPAMTVGFSRLRAMSPDGRSKAFDARANGYVRGEGVGMVVLKRLADARAAGDRIYAVIRGGAVNQDGRTNGLTAPNRWAQEAVLREAYKAAEVSPADVQYIEAHGTGTLLGDPIEAKSLGAVIGEGRSLDKPCAIGSVKTNIGHLESTAGVAGLIKVALSLQHREIPASLHFENPNPHIPFDKLPLRVQTELTPWPETNGPARAGISAFGFGGTNAHLVLEEAPQERTADAVASTRPASAHLLTLSAHTAEALKALARSYHDFLSIDEIGSKASLEDICQNAATRRMHHRHRLAIVARSREALAADLDAFARGEHRASISSGRRLPAGAPKIAFYVPKSACDDEPLAARLGTAWPEFKTAHEHFMQAAGLDAEMGSILPAAKRFILHFTLVQVWRSWGVEPDTLAGAESADLLACCLSGNIELREAITFLPSELADDANTIETLTLADVEHLKDEGIRLLVALGSQTPAAPVELDPGREPLPFLLPSLRSSFEWEQLLQTLGALYANGTDINWNGFYGGQTCRSISLPTYTFQRERFPLKPAASTSKEAAESHDRQNANTPFAQQLVRSHRLLHSRLATALPIFQATLDTKALPFLLDHRVHGAIVLPGAAMIEMALAAAQELLGSARVELCDVAFEKLLLLSADKPIDVQVSIQPASGNAHSFQIHSRSNHAEPLGDAWTLHASGSFQPLEANHALPDATSADLDQIQRRLREQMSPPQFYQRLAGYGLNYGEMFQAVERLWSGDGEALGQIALPRALSNSKDGWLLHPVMLDACLQVIAAAMPAGATASSTGGMFVPVGVGPMKQHTALPRRVWSHVKLGQALDVASAMAEVTIYDEDGQLVAEVRGVRFAGTVSTSTAPRNDKPVAIVAPADSNGVHKANGRLPTRDVLAGMSRSERRSLLEPYLCRRVAETLEIDPAQLDVTEPLSNVGLDSLMVFKLGVELDAELKFNVRLEDLADGPSVAEYTDRLLAQMEEC